ncbi:Clathrin coat assembly protein AP180 [Galdieria sulphuraria]|uniref:Clathrin assembly protein AP180 isoform 1 n=1 Tax=Galdieria sulphuraria TaxID=130081 RepID=M2X8P4_GALSU|nr:clathrin assembly protein AP180 isoform 1 [Galdieria sulphuraria]EME26207.1 clathrin assembly protein AP180 isoform 1 [Galdieria sulphuraria]GJD11254.1 Clathrin coat assembly protein AP180 [Galdieria sulphuraria]|eukprot:XP_005702727.1 clathrin assembly protein AP180 isoform 1 [Galdieria sulphuraria]
MDKYTRKATDATRIFTTHMTVNELKRAVTKATLDEETRPRMKDVQKIIDATFLRPSPHNTKCGPHKVLKYIQQRLRAGEWPVVLKALLLCHILLDEGSRGIVDLLLHSPFIFNLQEFRDASNPSAYDFSSYTRLFARYIQERIVTVRTLGAFYDTVREPRSYQQTAIQESEGLPTGQITTLELKQILKVMPTLENQLEVLTDVRLRAEELHNDLTIGIMERLMKDMLPLVNQLTQGVEVIQENFFTLSKNRCEDSLKVYQTYIELVEKANAFLAIGNRLGATESNISLEHAPLDYVKGMEEHISTLSEDGKSSDTASERRSHIDTIPQSAELQKVASGNYDEEAALAAAIKASLQESGSSTMISFDDDSDEEEQVQSDSASVEDPHASSKANNSIDDFFGLVESKDPQAANVSERPPSTEKPKKKNDDLLELLSDINVSSQHTASPGQGNLVPPMHTTNRTKSTGASVPDPNAASQQPQWNNEMDSQAPFQTMQGYYSTIGGMNMMPMFPSQHGMMTPNMMMTPYMTYGGPGNWSGMPMGGYPSGMYMQYNSNMGGWNPGLVPSMQPQQQMYPNYNNMSARIPGTAHSPPEYDFTHVDKSAASSHVNTSQGYSSRVEEKRRDPVFGELNPFGVSQESNAKETEKHQN